MWGTFAATGGVVSPARAGSAGERAAIAAARIAARRFMAQFLGAAAGADALFAKSPAFTIVILAGSMYLRMAFRICSPVNAFDLLLERPVPGERAVNVEVVGERARELRILRARPTWRDCSQPDFASAISLASKPSLRTRASSSWNAASSFASFCGA